MNEMLDNILYIFFYIFPVLMLIFGNRFKPNLDNLPVPIRMVDLITPYLLLSVAIQTKLAAIEPVHLYFYILLSVFGIGYATYLAFVKRRLLVGSFFRTWWRYTFIFALIYHLIVGGYGIYLNFV